MRVLALAIAVFALLIAPVLCYGKDEPPSPSACFQQAAERHNVPVELLIAVAEAESGLAPYAINRAGAAILPRSRGEAEAILSRIGAERTTFDVGIMQVNRWWFEKYHQPYDKGLDVCFNVDFGARILAMSIKDHGFTWEAVGSYHSPTGWRKSAYAKLIFARLSRILEKRKEMPLQELLERKLARANRETVATISEPHSHPDYTLEGEGELRPTLPVAEQAPSASEL